VATLAFGIRENSRARRGALTAWVTETALGQVTMNTSLAVKDPEGPARPQPELTPGFLSPRA